MQENFVKETKIVEKTQKDKDEDLLDSIKNSKTNLSNMYNNLNLAEGELVDYYIYRIKAEEAKYDYLLKKMKKGIQN